MKATEANLLSFLKKSPQFIIPIYQRTYSWTESECKQLWDDIIRVGNDNDIRAHFIGSIVYIKKDLYLVTIESALLVIDGQQRLTTVSLIIEALARHLPDDAEPCEGLSARKLRHYYLLNQEEQGEARYKLLLTQTDKQSLLSILEQEDLPAEHSLRLKENFEFFTQQVKKSREDLVPLCKGLIKLMVVEISLTHNQDNPQLIFESMNSTGRELSQADLIRNFILMGLVPAQQEHLYTKHWRPMEIAFGQEAYDTHFDSFMRHYLTVKTGDIPKIKQVYEAFKAHARDTQVSAAGVDALVADVHTFADYYCAMALDQEPNQKLKAAFHDLRELKVDVTYPLLLELYDRYKQDTLTDSDLESAVRMVESYVFRRAVCALPTNSLNKTFATFKRALKADRCLDSIRAHFLQLPSYRRFPEDEEFQHEIKQRNLYNFRSRSYWLRRMENHGRKEIVPVSRYTIEHILPQNENLSAKWRESLGENWERVQKVYLHTLGNLTLTAYNSEYSDHSFAEKRDMVNGFKDSPLYLNKFLGTTETWNEAAIQERAKRLAERAINVWQTPHLSDATLATYQTETEQGRYSIDDFPQLAEATPMRTLFDALRKELLALDPCVSETFLKHYIAYKAETNFVDIVPQTRQIGLCLNMAFYELDDPKNLARDVTNIGTWGNGDVEVKLNEPTDLPYAISLIRQAFERQMGDEEVDA